MIVTIESALIRCSVDTNPSGLLGIFAEAVPRSVLQRSEDQVMKTAKFLARFWDDQSGAAAEYVVILALIGTALVASVFLLSGVLAGAINDAASCINGTICP